MKHIEEYRDSAIVKGMLQKLRESVKKEIVIMEVCGTHTMSIFKSGLRDVMPENIELVSGPGCPVCVTSQGYIDTAIELSRREDVIITTFGDMLKIPGNESSLQKEKAMGGDIRVVYSPLDSIKIAAENPHKEVVFLAVGFETTAPVIALAVEKAKENEIKNFSILHSLKTIPGAMEQLVLDEELKIDGFLCPGHVSAVIGAKPYRFLSKEYNIPAVVAGFEPVDIVAGIQELAEMICSERSDTKNLYGRLVKEDGNNEAIRIMEKVFQSCSSSWRGLGEIPETGLRLKKEYSSFDVLNKLKMNMKEEKIIPGCICGDILKGKKKPLECGLFSRACTSENPVGACMVSEEGTCAAYFKYGNKEMLI